MISEGERVIIKEFGNLQDSPQHYWVYKMQFIYKTCSFLSTLSITYIDREVALKTKELVNGKQRYKNHNEDEPENS